MIHPLACSRRRRNSIGRSAKVTPRKPYRIIPSKTLSIDMVRPPPDNDLKDFQPRMPAPADSMWCNSGAGRTGLKEKAGRSARGASLKDQ
jgi:hypothetical protein